MCVCVCVCVCGGGSKPSSVKFIDPVSIGAFQDENTESTYVDPEKMLKPIPEPMFKWISECDEKSFVYMGQTLVKSTFMGMLPKRGQKKIKRGASQRRGRRDARNEWSVTNGTFTGGNLKEHVRGIVNAKDIGLDVDVEPTAESTTTTTTTTTTDSPNDFEWTHDVYRRNAEKLSKIDWNSGPHAASHSHLLWSSY